MLGKILGACFAVAVLVVLGAPFGREVYYRYEVWRHLDGVTDTAHRAAFDEWQGSARSFQQQLADQCRQVYGSGAAACERYKTASE